MKSQVEKQMSDLKQFMKRSLPVPTVEFAGRLYRIIEANLRPWSRKSGMLFYDLKPRLIRDLEATLPLLLYGPPRWIRIPFLRPLTWQRPSE